MPIPASQPRWGVTWVEECGRKILPRVSQATKSGTVHLRTPLDASTHGYPTIEKAKGSGSGEIAIDLTGEAHVVLELAKIDASSTSNRLGGVLSSNQRAYHVIKTNLLHVPRLTVAL